MQSITDLIARLPKAELHIHLEGSLEPDLLFQLAERNRLSLAYDSVDALRSAYVFSNLQEFLDIYYVGMQVLQTDSDFYDLAMAYFRRAISDNVRHAEVFFDPQAHVSRGVPIGAVVSGIPGAVAEARGLGLSVYLIPCFLRHLSAENAQNTLSELQPYLDKFHAIGLDSSELDNPPSQFYGVFERARRYGLKTVAHAGEEGPPDYIWQALDILQVDRIDHGNRAIEDHKLISRLAQSGTPLTMCPLSNLKLGAVDKLEEHPLGNMLEEGLVVTVNSDDPAYFGGYINENFLQVADALQLSAEHIICLARNSFKASFLLAEEKVFWQNEISAIEQEVVEC